MFTSITQVTHHSFELFQFPLDHIHKNRSKLCLFYQMKYITTMPCAHKKYEQVLNKNKFSNTKYSTGGK